MARTGTPPAMDWEAFAQVLLDDALALVLPVLQAHPLRGDVYAVAMAGIYREHDGPIYLPTVSMGSEAALAEAGGAAEDGGTLYSLRWNPVDWCWPEMSSDSPSVAAAQTALAAQAQGGDVAQWEATDRHCIDALVNVCRRLQAALITSPVADRLAPGFAVLLHEDSGEGIAMARRSLGDEAFARLLPGHAADLAEAQRVAALPHAERLRYHIACLAHQPAPDLGLTREQARHHGGEEAQRALRGFGMAAIEALLPLLAHASTQCEAARLLGEIGAATPEVMAALRLQVLQPVPRNATRHRAQAGRNICAGALAHLGDSAWLLQQAQAGQLADECVAQGLASPYGAFRNSALGPLPLDYLPIESLPAVRPALLPLVEQWLRPGAGTCTLRPQEVDEAVRGLQSPLTVVRQHAAMVLGDRALGAQAAQRIVPALAHAVAHDGDETVRFLAVLALDYWRGEAAAQRPLAEATAAGDASAKVRDAAQRWLQALDDIAAGVPPR